ncbi:DUF3575 domain-containing protein [uncultured Proteiniphilum sp.]|uniref:DUF3575 domain-containing protein n=1 Tax=uncultured Proteiniphilum sp. TaxID=497637 RepID=UPI00261BCF2B|nr:DUF3575 domain-containing protein [uncultured Proteiniphilum sp.]
MILLLCISFGARASTPPSGSELPSHFIFYFANNSSLLMRDYYTNQTALEKLDQMLKNPDFISGVDSITIFGSASLIGSFQVNSRLSYERAMAVRTYIRWKHPGVYNDRISVLPSVFNWDVLIDLIQNDPLVPYREETLRILNSSVDNQLKVIQIKQLGGGSTNSYITNNFAKYMRTATSVFFSIKEKKEEIKEPEVIEVQNDSVPIVVDDIEEIVEEPEELPEIVSPIISLQQKMYSPLFALKTNILYDLLSGLNVEVEVPVGEHFSLAGEWIFPWWLYEKKQYALEILSGNLELRYWWGDRTGRDQMTGWFTGVYAGAGLYDIEWKTKGYQGEFIIPFGLSGGFAHKISRNWRMEYSLGVGYMTNKYREYIPQKCGYDDEWHLIKQKSGKSAWIGPTRAKVSLVWMINKK